MAFQLPELPYAMDALHPHISKETLEYHYGKHHATYITNLNKLIAGTPLENANLEQIIKESKGPTFNNAAQTWNHTFYWYCMSPKANRAPTGTLLAAINKEFGSFAEFRDKFSQTATTLFGSGWTWLVKKENGSLGIETTSNAGNPMTNNQKPLLTCDVWEHAYYIDYRNARAKYVEKFFDIINWDFVQKNFQY